MSVCCLKHLYETENVLLLLCTYKVCPVHSCASHYFISKRRLLYNPDSAKLLVESE